MKFFCLVLLMIFDYNIAQREALYENDTWLFRSDEALLPKLLINFLSDNWILRMDMMVSMTSQFG